MYAYKAKDGQLHTGICSRTRPISEAVDDLQFIETLRTAKPGGRVSGVIKHWERDLAGNETRQYPPLSFVQVQVNGPGGGGQAETDEQGRYEITGLRPGKYEVQVFPAANFSTTLLQRDVELRDARACAVVDFGAHFDGRISGTVRTADGRPAGDVRVQLVAAAKAAARGIAETLTATSDSDGHYELRDVPPGQYVVGVGLKRSMESLDDLYPRTFYPGATAASAAEVITVGEGNRQELQPFTLPPPRRRREIVGFVVWPDGRPAIDVSVSLADADESWRQLAAGIRTEGDGSFRFTVYEGGVQGACVCRHSRRAEAQAGDGRVRAVRRDRWHGASAGRPETGEPVNRHSHSLSNAHAAFRLEPEATLPDEYCGFRLQPEGCGCRCPCRRASRTRACVNGTRRSLTPVASKNALPSAAATGTADASPAPHSG